jgi:transcriptional regulator GlxA family with amidase domain
MPAAMPAAVNRLPSRTNNALWSTVTCGGQPQFSPWTSAPAVKSEPLRSALDAVALDPAGDHSLRAMAERTNFSIRHLTRLFEEQVGLTAGAYVERVRVEAARAMLEGGDEGLPVVANRTGFGSTETMRRAFLRELGVTPGAYRAQFRTTGITDDGRRNRDEPDIWPDIFSSRAGLTSGIAPARRRSPPS